MGHGLLIREVSITHNDVVHMVGLLWMSDQLVAETSTWQHITLTTDKHPYPWWDWTHDLSRRAAAGLRLRLRGHWDRLNCNNTSNNYNRKSKRSPSTHKMKVESSWNVMAHDDAREGKWRGKWWMEWVASTLHTTKEHGVCSITTADAHTSAASNRLNWSPRRFKWTRPFRRKTKSGFCACAITFQLASIFRGGLMGERRHSSTLNLSN